MDKSGVRSQKSQVRRDTPRLTSHVLRLTAFSVFIFLYGCQLPALAPKGTAINKTNPNFLKEAGVDEKTNPHRDEKCLVCHKASRDTLTKENPADDEIIQRRLMRTDLNDLCAGCHKDRASIDAEHIVGIETKLNRQNLPLDHEGKITCATTCHDVHTKDPGLAKGMLRHPFDTLCLSCHDV